MRETTPARIQADASAALAALTERTGETRAVVVGFCFGGLQSFLCAASAELRHEGVVAFYGALDGTRLGAPSPPDHVTEMPGPILGLFGGADHAIPAESVAAFDAALAEAGLAHESVTYPGAPHSFFDRKQEEFAEASQDAWRRVRGVPAAA